MSQTVTHERIVNSTSNGIIATNAEGIIVFANNQAKNILKLDKDSVIDTFICDILPMTGSHVLKCLQKGEPQLGLLVLGDRIPLVVDVTIIRDAGKALGSVSSFQKLEQFEHSARQLESYKQLTRQLDTIINSSADGIWICDGEGIVIAVNKAALKLDKIKAVDVIGQSIYDLVESGLFDRSTIIEVFETRQQTTLLSKAIKSSKTLLITGTPVFDNHGDISLVVVNVRDMTQLNEVQEQLEQTRLVSEKFQDKIAELSLLELSRQDFIAETDSMRQLLHMALKIAKMEASNILVRGESGTGKGLVAKFIHQNSKRCNKPFIQINCAALPENLLEAELFGYEKGAFTGAREEGKAGLFELAQNGTLFLDEIGDLPFSVQAKLLKYLDDHTIIRLGGTKSIKINCIVIAATNRDLETLTKKKKFREDLIYRLNTFTIHIPPLRERPEDIFELIRHYLDRYNKEFECKRSISAGTIKFLQTYPFPGNVRELKNILKMAVVTSETNLMDKIILSNLELKADQMMIAGEKKRKIYGLTDEVAACEKQIFKRAMTHCRTTRELAAYLNVSQPTIVRKLQKHGLSGLARRL